MNDYFTFKLYEEAIGDVVGIIIIAIIIFVYFMRRR